MDINVSLVYNFFRKETSCSGIQNKKLAEELCKPIIRKFKKEKYNHLL